MYSCVGREGAGRGGKGRPPPRLHGKLSPMQRPRPPLPTVVGWRRALAALLAVAFLFGLSSDAVVQADAFVEHVVCPEDGAVVHAEGVEARGEAVGELRAEAPHAHDISCQLGDLAGTREGWAASPVAISVLACGPLPALAPFVPGAARARNLLFEAPKTSPPMVA